MDEENALGLTVGTLDTENVVKKSEETINNDITVPTDNIVRKKSKKEPIYPPGFGTKAARGSSYADNTPAKFEAIPDYDSFYKYLPKQEGITLDRSYWESERALRQSNWNQFGNAAARVAINIIPETIQQASNMLDFSNDFESDNIIGKQMQEWKDWGNEVTPIYRENPGEAMDFGDFAYYMEQGSSLITSIAAFGLLGAGTGGALGALGKGASVLAKGASVTGSRILATEALAPVANTVSKIGNITRPGTMASNIKNAIMANAPRTIQGLTQSYLMTKAEGVGVALETFKLSEEKYIKEGKEKQKETGKTDAEINTEAKKKASEDAAFAFNMNELNFLLNLTSSFNFIKPSVLGSRLKLNGEGLFSNALNVGEESIKRKLINKSLGLAGEGGQEALEEIVNYSAQERALDGGADKSFSENFKGFLKDAMTERGIEAGLLGAIGGIGQTGITSLVNYAPLHNNDAYKKEFQNSRISLIEDNKNKIKEEAFRIRQERKEKNLPPLEEAELVKEATAKVPVLTTEEIEKLAKEEATKKVGSSSNYVSKNFLEKYKENKIKNARREVLSTFNFNDDGTLKDDSRENIKKLSDAFDNAEDLMSYKKEEEILRQAGDINGLTELRNKHFNNQVIKAMNNGTLNTLEDVFKSMKNLTQEEAVSRGLAEDVNDFSYKSNIDKALKTINIIENSAFNNRKYLNVDTVTALDVAILLEEDILKQNKKNLDDYISDNIKEDDSYKDFLKGKNRSYLSFERDDYKKHLEFERKLLKEDKDFKTLYNNLKTSEIRLEKGKEERKALTSYETQRELRRIEIDTLKLKKEYMAELKRNQQLAKYEKRRKEIEKGIKEKTAKKAAKEAAKKAANTPPKVETPKTETSETETPKVEAPKIEAPKVVTSEETTSEGTTEVKIDLPKPTTKTEPTSLLSADLKAFVEKYKDDQVITDLLRIVNGRIEYFQNGKQKETDFNEAWFDERIKSYNVFKVDTNDTADVAAFVLRNAKIGQEYEKNGISVVNQYNRLIDEQIAIMSAIKDTYLNLQNLTTSLIIERDAFEDNEESTEEDSNEPLNEVTIGLDNSPEISSVLDLPVLLLKIIKELENSKLPISSFDDLLLHLTNATSESLITPLLPRLASTWNYIVDQNKLKYGKTSLENVIVDEVSLSNLLQREIDILFDTFQDDEVIENYISELILKSDENIEILNAGQVTNTAFKIAYLGKSYIEKKRVNGNFIISIKQDENLDLNPNAGYPLLDPSLMIKGDSITFIPLGVKETYKYPKDGLDVFITRINKTEVQKTTKYPDGEVTEILPANEHLPIFISSSSSRKDIIPGAFLHVPSWVKKGKIYGTDEEIEEERTALLNFRTTLVNNVTRANKNKKHFKTTIKETSLGKLLTKQGYSYTYKNIPEKVKIATLSSNKQLIYNGVVVPFNNKIDLEKFPISTPFLILPSGNNTLVVPLRKERIEDFETTVIKDSIMKTIEFYFTPENALSDTQKNQKQALIKKGVNLNTFKGFQNYINTFLYSNIMNNNDIEYDLNDFQDVLDSKSSFYSIFRLFEKDGVAHLHFGNTGDTANSFSSLDFKDNLDENLDLLSAVLDNTLLNIDIKRLEKNKKIIGIKKDKNGNETVDVIFDSYVDLLRNTTSTNLAPAEITNPKTGNSKIIYTIQRVIYFDIPKSADKRNVVDEEENENKNTEKGIKIEGAEEVIVEDTPTETEEEEDNDDFSLDNFDDYDDIYEVDAFDSEEDTEEEESIFRIENSQTDDEFNKLAVISKEDLEEYKKTYSFIEGLSSGVQTSFVDEMKFHIEEVITKTGETITYSEAFNYVLNKVISNRNAFIKSFTSKSIKEQNNPKNIKKYNAILNQFDKEITILKENKFKVVRRLKTLISKEALFIGLKGAQKKEFVKRQRKLRKKVEKEQERKEKALQANTDTTVIGDVGDTNDALAEELIVVDLKPREEEENTSFDFNALQIDPKQELEQEIRHLFYNITDYKKVVNPKTGDISYQPLKNKIGFNQRIPFNTVYQKVQELLAVYPDSTPIEPNIDSFIAVLEENIVDTPYLKDVVKKLKERKAKNDIIFIQSFIKSMYKFYHNSTFNYSVYDRESDSYRTRTLSSDSSKVPNKLKDAWLVEFNNSDNYYHSSSNEILIKREVLKDIYTLYNEVKNSNFDKDSGQDVMEKIEKIYSYIGITLPLEFKQDLINNTHSKFKNGVFSFAKSNIFTNTVEHIIGNKTSKTVKKEIGDLQIFGLYDNSAFYTLGQLIGNYSKHLPSNSSKDLNGENQFNFGDIKNFINSFMNFKFNKSHFLTTIKDPYRMISKEDIKLNKRFKTWIEDSFAIGFDESESIISNENSFINKAFEYFTVQGDKIISSKGEKSTVVAELNYTDTLNNRLSTFLNNGKTINGVHIAGFNFFTLSDKKIPVGITAPSYNFYMGGLLSSNIPEDIKQNEDKLLAYQMERQQIIDYFYNVLIKPDLTRMLMKQEEYNKINSSAYNKTNSRFFTLPLLNTIDFDYVDGDRSKGKDEKDSLRKQLLLEKNEQLFIVSEDGMEYTPNEKVLSNKLIQAFLKEKMKQQLLFLINKNEQEFIKVGIFKKDGNVLKRGHNAVFDYTGLSSLGYAKGNDKDSVKENLISLQPLLINYTLNSTLALAQMQQTLIGDPIQFFKKSDATKKNKEVLVKLNTSLAELSLDFEKGTISEQKYLHEVDEYNQKIKEIKENQFMAFAIEDVKTTYDNQGKRLGGDNASGTNLQVEGEPTTFNTLVIEDKETASEYLDTYLDLLVPEVIKNLPEDTAERKEEKTDQINKYIQSYKKINEADAQEFTTLKEHLNVLIGDNVITAKERDYILEQDEKGELDIEEYIHLLSPLKLVYNGNSLRDNMYQRTYVKSSSFPLTKSLTKGLPIDKLRVYLEQNDIQRVAFASAVKVGTPSKLADVFKDGDVVIDKNAFEAATITLERQYHKKQQNVPFDPYKDANNDGTQKAKLNLVDLMDEKGFIHPETGKAVDGREIDAYQSELYRAFYKHQYDELVSKLFPKGLNSPKNYKYLQRLLKEEGIKRGYNENDMAYLDLLPDGSGFRYPLWLSNNNNKLGSLLNSIVDNKVRKRKRKGKSYVLLSDIFLDTSLIDTNIIYIGKDRPTKLRPMRTDKNGKVHPAEIIVPFNFKDDNGNLLDINDFIIKDENGESLLDTSKLPEEILEAIGFRIPTQGNNSTSFVKIVGFLPPGNNNAVIAPKEFIAQMGSDFDIDKLYMDMYNTVYNEETKSLSLLTQSYIDSLDSEKDKTKIAKYTKQLIENKLLDVGKAILSNPSKNVQKQIASPIDNIVLNTIKYELVPLVYDENLSSNWMASDDLYQISKYLGGRNAKNGVSSFSSDSVFNALLQKITSSVHFQTYNEKKSQWYKDTYTIFKTSSNSLNDKYSSDGNLKSDLISALQSISVDNENLQMMYKLNLNKHTFPFIRAAVQLGFSAKDIILIINHPMIKDYVEKQDTNTTFAAPNNYRMEKNEEGKLEKVYYNKKEIKAYLNNLYHEDFIEDINTNNTLITVNNGKEIREDIKSYAIFNFFEELSKKGQQLQSIESIVNIDSTGLGSNYFYSLEKEKAFSRLFSIRNIKDIHKLIGDIRFNFNDLSSSKELIKKVTPEEYRKEEQKYNEDKITNGFLQYQNVWFKPYSTSLLSLGYGLLLNNKIWENEFPYKNVVINAVLENLQILENNKFDDTLLKSIFNRDTSNELSLNSNKDSKTNITTMQSFIAYLFTSAVNTNASSIRKSLFKEDNITEIIKDLQSNVQFKNNMFVQLLENVSISLSNNTRLKDTPENTLDTFIFSSNNDVNEQDLITGDIILLLNNNSKVVLNNKEYVVSEVVKKLIMHQLLTSGVQKANQFIKYIPPAYLKEIGVYDSIYSSLNDPDIVNGFLEQYIQHNPTLVKSVHLQSAISKGTIKISNNTITTPDILKSLKNLKDVDLPSFPPYVSFTASSNITRLFKLIDNVYYEIPTLGFKNNTEYDVNNKGTAESIFDSLNPKIKWYQSLFLNKDKDTRLLREAITTISSLFKEGNKTKDKEKGIVKICD